MDDFLGTQVLTLRAQVGYLLIYKFLYFLPFIDL